MDVAGISITASRFVVLSREENLDRVQVVDEMCKNLSLESEEMEATVKLQKSEQGVLQKAEGESSKPGVGSQLTMHHTEEENKPCDGAPVTEGNGSRAQLSDTAAGCGPWMHVGKNGKVQRPITKTRGLILVEMFDEHGRQELEKSKGSPRSILPIEDCGDQTSKRSGRGAGSKAPKHGNQNPKMTLDEWKRKSACMAPQACQLRKAGEGVDQSQWADYRPLKKKTYAEPSYENARKGSSEAKRASVKTVPKAYSLQRKARLMGHGTPEPKSNHVCDHAPLLDESDFPALC